MPLALGEREDMSDHRVLMDLVCQIRHLPVAIAPHRDGPSNRVEKLGHLLHSPADQVLLPIEAVGSCPPSWLVGHFLGRGGDALATHY